MSVRITRKGLFDSIQDFGRYGYQHLGINPGGVMDRIAAAVANMLLDNDANEPVIEMHFPAASMLFEAAACIALSGADFGAMINKQPVPLNTAITANANDLLEFTAYKAGARVYLAVEGGWQAGNWLNSYSTNFKAWAGGHNGAVLRKDDVIGFKHPNPATAGGNAFCISADTSNLYRRGKLRFVKGAAFEALTESSKQALTMSEYVITAQSDRMGYRLQGEPLERTVDIELISAAITRGTIQLLPSGQLIVLMADHQTTGGYPVVGHVISADLTALAQKRTNEKISFEMVSIEEAEAALLLQQQQLLRLRGMLTGKKDS